MVFDTFVLGIIFLWLAISIYTDTRKERYDEGAVHLRLFYSCYCYYALRLVIILLGGLWFCM